MSAAAAADESARGVPEMEQRIQMQAIVGSRNKRKMTQPKRLLPSNAPGVGMQILHDNANHVGDAIMADDSWTTRSSGVEHTEVVDLVTCAFASNQPLDLRSSTEFTQQQQEQEQGEEQSSLEDIAPQFDIGIQSEAVAKETRLPCLNVAKQQLHRPGDAVAREMAPRRDIRKNYKHMTRQRRMEANARERSRVHTISAAFESLRRAVPSYAYNQRLSKLAILRIACSYIVALARLADLDYNGSDDGPMDFAECVDMCTRTIQAHRRNFL